MLNISNRDNPLLIFNFDVQPFDGDPRQAHQLIPFLLAKLGTHALSYIINVEQYPDPEISEHTLLLEKDNKFAKLSATINFKNDIQQYERAMRNYEITVAGTNSDASLSKPEKQTRIENLPVPEPPRLETPTTGITPHEENSLAKTRENIRKYDAAADQALKAIEKAVAKHGMHDHRPVFVHATYLRDDQIAKMKTYGAVPSFLTSGILPGGDAVTRMWGEDRAGQAMAARTMLEEGIPFTFSHDAPVSPEPWILTLVSCGVNRKTPSGRIIGPDQRIPPYAALRAVTAMAAYEIKEEKSKGTLEPGKLADLVILDKNPLEVPPDTIDDIAVLETIKEGKTIWRRGEERP
jgi:hypothetical protein